MDKSVTTPESTPHIVLEHSQKIEQQPLHSTPLSTSGRAAPNSCKAGPSDIQNHMPVPVSTLNSISVENLTTSWSSLEEQKALIQDDICQLCHLSCSSEDTTSCYLQRKSTFPMLQYVLIYWITKLDDFSI